MSAVIPSPVPTELRARLYTWLLLLLVVFVSAALLWMAALLSFAVLNLMAEGVLGYGADETWHTLFMTVSAVACGILGAFVYACLVRGTLREG